MDAVHVTFEVMVMVLLAVVPSVAANAVGVEALRFGCLSCLNPTRSVRLPAVITIAPLLSLVVLVLAPFG